MAHRRFHNEDACIRIGIGGAVEQDLLESRTFARVLRNVPRSAHTPRLWQVLTHELLVAQKQEARGAQDRTQEILQMVQSTHQA